jgi:hypothetical protein
LALDSPASSVARTPSSVFMLRPVFLTLTLRLRVTTMRARFVLWNRSLTCARTSFSPAICKR